ncbi:MULTISPECIES: site-specific integrase [unclassified Butyrivibrio]|uniref:site-specific integrase n=1 Tax=unclassified Butyrivibrio TaxID=2639466 RepID=UPI000876F0FC|nr:MULTISPECIES: site-specific integrase [unclassified Butyrivibrio]SCY14922.1 Site-specific recombinase XerD [Butyrivibrio sp. INlla14]SDB52247.1 Site-specific recombinase XerD [Butyrivibrio sp. INlla16]
MSRPKADSKNTRKDKNGYALRKGESQKKDGRYVYNYKDGFKKRRFVYANTLMELREKEKLVMKEMAYELDYASASKMTLNTLYDRYISQNYKVMDSTRAGYNSLYNCRVRNGFGLKRIVDIKYSDLKIFYHSLLVDEGLSGSTVERINNLIQPSLKLAVRDQLLLRNPAEGVLTEIKASDDWVEGERFALSIPQQRSFMNFIYNSTEFKGWYPLIATLIGTGMRISECLGLEWKDIDLSERFISVNHTLEYRPVDDTGKCIKRIELPKTEAGTRLIPIFDEVMEAIILEYQYQKVLGFCTEEVDGHSGFVFCTSEHKTYLQGAVNRAIKSIIAAHNEAEEVLAAEDGREPIILPHFTCHNLRHTFCTRLCEVESNVKVIQDIMGHSDFSTTMDIYTEVHKEKKQEVLSYLQGKFIIR